MSYTGQLSYRLASLNARSRSARVSSLRTGNRAARANVTSAVAASHRPRLIPVSKTFETSSQSKLGATTSTPEATSLSSNVLAGAPTGVCGSSKSTNTEASTTATPVLKEHVQGTLARSGPNAALPFFDFVQPGKQAGIRCRHLLRDASIQFHHSLIQMHHIDSVAGSSLDSREPARPDPSSDRLFGPPGPPRCLTNSELLRRCHASTLLQQLLLHQCLTELCPVPMLGDGA